MDGPGVTLEGTLCFSSVQFIGHMKVNTGSMVQGNVLD